MNRTRRVGRMDSPLNIEQLSDKCTDLGICKLYKFDTAITSGVTAVPDGSVAGLPAAAVGDMAITTHGTGDESLFKNIGGVWTAV